MEGFGEVVGLFLVYEQPVWQGCAPSHAVLHPIASPSTPLPLRLVSPMAGSLAPLFPLLPCTRSSPPVVPEAGLLWVLAHPRCPVPSFGWVDTAHLAGAHRQLQSRFCRAPLQLPWGYGGTLWSCLAASPDAFVPVPWSPLEPGPLSVPSQPEH